MGNRGFRDPNPEPYPKHVASRQDWIIMGPKIWIGRAKVGDAINFGEGKQFAQNVTTIVNLSLQLEPILSQLLELL